MDEGKRAGRPRRAKRLNALAVAAATGEQNIHDGAGLYLRVRRDGSKAWAFRYSLAGRAHWLGLGPVAELSLAAAREKARELRAQLRDGVDPLAARRARRAEAVAAAGRTFRAASIAYVTAHAPAWRNEKHAQQWTSTLAVYAWPAIGDLPVAAVGLDDVLLVIAPIWRTKPETAARLRGRIERILDYATVHKWRDGSNPARWRGFLDQILPARSKIAPVRHHAAIDWRDLPAAYAMLAGKETTSALCLRWLILTAARSGEARGAVWGEIDREAGLWRVPGERMKAGRDHTVPLSSAALAVLDAAAQRSHSPEELIFPGARPGRPLTDVALSKALAAVRPGATVHGLRAGFRTWAQEATDFAAELAEIALSHVNKDKTEAAYARGAAIDRRRRMLEAWAAHVEGREAGAVIPLRSGR